MKKKWYDYLWIASLTYLILGFFNILFAWLGLLCFFIPLIMAVAGGKKGIAIVFADVVSCLACWVGVLACPEKKMYRGG